MNEKQARPQLLVICVFLSLVIFPMASSVASYIGIAVTFGTNRDVTGYFHGALVCALCCLAYFRFWRNSSLGGGILLLSSMAIASTVVLAASSIVGIRIAVELRRDGISLEFERMFYCAPLVVSSCVGLVIVLWNTSNMER